jgi:hypothetical protein
MKQFMGVLLLFCLGCAHKSDAPNVHVSLTDSGRSVKFSGLAYDVMSEINRDSLQSSWQGLLPVFRMPADTDLKDYQPVQPGTYRLKDSAVVFTPDTPFITGKAYFMRYYRLSKTNETMDFIQGKKKLREIPYTDLVFK